MKTLAESLGVLDIAVSEDKPDTTNKKFSARAIAKRVLSSNEYEQSLMRRVTTDTLAPAVECKLYEYAFGKPVDKVEVHSTSDNLEDLSSEQLEARAMSLATLARKLRGEEDGTVTEAGKASAGPLAPGVH